MYTWLQTRLLVLSFPILWLNNMYGGARPWHAGQGGGVGTCRYVTSLLFADFNLYANVKIRVKWGIPSIANKLACSIYLHRCYLLPIKPGRLQRRTKKRQLTETAHDQNLEKNTTWQNLGLKNDYKAGDAESHQGKFFNGV